MKLSVSWALALFTLVAFTGGCQTRRPGVTSVNGYFVRYSALSSSQLADAAVDTVDHWSLILSNRTRTSSGGERITAINHQGTKFRIKIDPQGHGGTKLAVRIEPGYNEGVSLRLIEDILQGAAVME